MLENFVGNEQTLLTLKNLLINNRLPHAIMLEGDDGTGKHTVAKSIAKSILCENNTVFCNTCRACHLFDVGTNGDFITVSPQKNIISVATIREMRKSVYERPANGDRKVYLIEHAEKMNREAQNALLKILEEPPAYAVFILLASSSAVLLDTIISRCSVFSLTSPDYTTALNALKGLKPDKSENEISAALVANDNNIGRALLALSDSEGTAFGDVQTVLNALSVSRSYDVIKTLNKYNWDMAGFSEFLTMLSAVISNLLRNITLGNPTEYQLSRNELIRLAGEVQQTEKYIKLNCQGELLITDFCARIVADI